MLRRGRIASWLRAKVAMRWRELWHAWTTDRDLEALTELFMVMLLLPLSTSLWGVDWVGAFVFERWLRALSAGPVLGVTLGALVVGGVLLERVVGLRSPPSRPGRPGQRLVRIGLASIPWVGVLSLVQEARAQVRGPSIAGDGCHARAVVPEAPPRRGAGFIRAIGGRVLHEAERTIYWPVMIVLVQTMAAGALCLWLAAPVPLSPRRWWCNLGVAVCLHLIGLRAAWRRSAVGTAATTSRPWTPRRRLLARICWMLPWPIPFAGVLAWLCSGPETYSGLAVPSRSPGGIELLATVLGPRSAGRGSSLVRALIRRSPRARDLRRVDLAGDSLLRAKAALLLFDGMACSGALMALGSFDAGRWELAVRLGQAAVVISAVGWAAALILVCVRIVRAELGRIIGRDDAIGIAGQLAVGWLGLGAGLGIGLLIAVGLGVEAGLALVLLGFVQVALIGLRYGPGSAFSSIAAVSSANLLPATLWVAAALAGSLMGALMAVLPHLRAQLITVLQLLWIVVPLLHPVLGVLQLRALMAPIPPRRSLDPTAPGQVQRAGALVMLAAMAPLGGMLVPLALALRRRSWSVAEIWWDRVRKVQDDPREMPCLGCCRTPAVPPPGAGRGVFR